jgi:hypothetical protein
MPNFFHTLPVERDYWLYLNNKKALDAEKIELFDQLHNATDQDLIKLRSSYKAECIVVYIYRKMRDQWALIDQACRDNGLLLLGGGKDSRKPEI